MTPREGLGTWVREVFGGGDGVLPELWIEAYVSVKQTGVERVWKDTAFRENRICRGMEVQNTMYCIS